MSEIYREALQFLASGTTEDLGLVGFTIAHLRIPRVEFMSWTSLDEAMEVIAQLIVDQAMAALSTTTWPVHDH